MATNIVTDSETKLMQGRESRHRKELKQEWIKSKEDSIIPIDRCQFIQSKPIAIQAVSVYRDLLAVAYKDASIDVYKLSVAYSAFSYGLKDDLSGKNKRPNPPSWQLRYHIPARANASIETMVWWPNIGPTELSFPWLLTAGIDGQIVQWEYSSTQYQGWSLDASNSPIWCMSLQDVIGENSQVLAIGCEDGTVRLFTLKCIANPNQVSFSSCPLQLEKSLIPTILNHDGYHQLEELDHQNPKKKRYNSDSNKSKRCLALAWNPNRQNILASAGADGSIHIWNTQSDGRIVSTFQSSNLESDSHDSTIWALQWVQQGKVLVSGDSRGRVRFWQFEPVSAHLQTIQAHEASIFTLSTSPMGSTTDESGILYASGLDPKICQFRYHDGRWKITGHRRRHTHDVRQLVSSIGSQCLVSGGLDGSIVLHHLSAFPYDRTCVIGRSAFISIAEDTQKILVSSSPYHKLQLWKLDPFSLELELPLISSHSLPNGADSSMISLSCIGLSNSGDSFILATSSFIQIYSLLPEKDSKKHPKSLWKHLLTSDIGAHRLCFLSDTVFAVFFNDNSDQKAVCTMSIYRINRDVQEPSIKLLSKEELSGHVIESKRYTVDGKYLLTFLLEQDLKNSIQELYCRTFDSKSFVSSFSLRIDQLNSHISGTDEKIHSNSKLQYYTIDANKKVAFLLLIQPTSVQSQSPKYTLIEWSFAKNNSIANIIKLPDQWNLANHHWINGMSCVHDDNKKITRIFLWSEHSHTILCIESNADNNDRNYFSSDFPADCPNVLFADTWKSHGTPSLLWIDRFEEPLEPSTFIHKSYGTES
jgi:WD40 repeat protein